MLCFICAAQLKFGFQTDLGSQTSASFYRQGRHASCFWLFSPCSRVGRALRPTFMLWLVKTWQVSSCGNLCSILKLAIVYFDSWSWQSFVSTCDIFNCLFSLNVQNEIQLLSRVFCYSWLVCLLGFWLRNTSLVKVRNPISDGIVFVFHLPWCVRGLKSLKRFWSYLIVFSASRMVSLSNYCIWRLFFILFFNSKIWDNDLTE